MKNKFELDEDVFTTGRKNLMNFSEVCSRTGNMGYLEQYLIDEDDLNHAQYLGSFYGLECSIKKRYYKNYVKITIASKELKFHSHTVKVKYSFFNLDDTEHWARYIKYKTDKKVAQLITRYFDNYNEILLEQFESILGVIDIYKKEKYKLIFKKDGILEIIKDDLVFNFDYQKCHYLSDVGIFGLADNKLKTIGFAFLINQLTNVFAYLDLDVKNNLYKLGEVL